MRKGTLEAFKSAMLQTAEESTKKQRAEEEQKRLRENRLTTIASHRDALASAIIALTHRVDLTDHVRVGYLDVPGALQIDWRAVAGGGVSESLSVRVIVDEDAASCLPTTESTAKGFVSFFASADGVVVRTDMNCEDSPCSIQEIVSYPCWLQGFSDGRHMIARDSQVEAEVAAWLGTRAGHLPKLVARLTKQKTSKTPSKAK